MHTLLASFPGTVERGESLEMRMYSPTCQKREVWFRYSSAAARESRNTDIQLII